MLPNLKRKRELPSSLIPISASSLSSSTGSRELYYTFKTSREKGKEKDNHYYEDHNNMTSQENTIL